jgi:predicted amidohydrolase
MLTKIGFFQLSDDDSEPFGSLTKALRARSEDTDVRDSLIVLPEAFNYGRSYYRDPSKEPKFSLDESVKDLATISKELGVVFVSSLLHPPSSSAYWIDRNGSRLMCHKKSADSSKTYTPWSGDCGGNNPLEYEGARIGVLICNEVDRYASGLAATLDESSAARKIICIPACMTSMMFGAPLTARWSGKYVILANRRPWPDGCKSFIGNTTGQMLCLSEGPNQIVLRAWGEL